VGQTPELRTPGLARRLVQTHTAAEADVRHGFSVHFPRLRFETRAITPRSGPTAVSWRRRHLANGRHWRCGQSSVRRLLAPRRQMASADAQVSNARTKAAGLEPASGSQEAFRSSRGTTSSSSRARSRLHRRHAMPVGAQSTLQRTTRRSGAALACQSGTQARYRNTNPRRRVAVPFRGPETQGAIARRVQHALAAADHAGPRHNPTPGPSRLRSKVSVQPHLDPSRHACGDAPQPPPEPPNPRQKRASQRSSKTIGPSIIGRPRSREESQASQPHGLVSVRPPASRS
jgi:hypothetical protein